MGFAVARGIRSENPAFRGRRFPEKKLEHFLSPAEIARLGEALAAAEALGAESPSAIAAIRLLVLTGFPRLRSLKLVAQLSEFDCLSRSGNPQLR